MSAALLSFTAIDSFPAEADSGSYTPGPSPTATCQVSVCLDTFPTGDDGVHTPVDTPVSVDVLANDCHSTLAGNTREFTVTSAVTQSAFDSGVRSAAPGDPDYAGAVAVRADRLVFTPKQGFDGVARFDYYWIETGPEVDPSTGDTFTNTRNAAGSPFAAADPAVVTVAVGSATLPTTSVSMPPAVGLGASELAGAGNESEACGCAHGKGGDPIDTATGTFWQRFTDLTTPGRGPVLALQRTYNSAAAAQDGPFGHGWSFSYSANLVTDPSTGSIAVNQESGSQVVFTPNPDGSYSAAQLRDLATLAVNADGTYIFTRRERQKLTFNAAGQLLKVADLNGYETTLTYDSSGDLITVTDQAGRSYDFAMANHRIVRVTDPANRSFDYGYSAAGDLTGVTDPTGATTTFTYDNSHRMLTMLDPRQQGSANPTPLTNVYDAAGRVTSQTDPASRTTSFDYTAITGATKITLPAGEVTVDYYTNGLRTRSTAAYGTIYAASTDYTYDPVTEALASVTDSLQHSTSYTHDARGNVTATTDALHRSTSATYDGLDDLLTSTDGDGVTTTNVYDAAGNLQSTSTPLLSATGTVLATRTTSYTYGDPTHPGDVTATTAPDSHTTSFVYDDYGDLVSRTDPPTPENASGDETTYSYDVNTGLRIGMTAPKGNLAGANAADYTTTYLHDLDGRLIETRDPLWNPASPTLHRTLASYDADGNTTSSTDGNGKTTSYAYDADNELTTTTRADGTTLQQTWTPDGRLHTYSDAAANTTVYTYDIRDNLRTKQDPLGHSTGYRYDSENNLVLTLAPGATCSGSQIAGCTSYQYDADNELTALVYLDGLTSPVTGITYDNDGRRTGQTDGSGSSTWTYDSLGRLISSTDGTGTSIGYGYDLAGNQTSISYPGAGHTVSRTFDSANKVAAITDWANHGASFSYDANGMLTTTAFDTYVTDTTTYDNANEVLGMTSGYQLGKVIYTGYSFAYSRDGNGQLASATTSTTSPSGVSEPQQTYGYNDLEQLIATGSASTPTQYAYDTADDITSRGTTAGGPANSAAYNAGSEICWSSGTAVTSPACASPPSGSTTFGYDLGGNRTSATAGLTTSTFAYDEAHRLIGSTTSAGTTTYSYDGDGLRQSATTGASTSTFTWDHSSGVPMLLSDGTSYYVYGPGGLPLEQITGNVTTDLHHDQLGSTRLLTDATGLIAGTYTYDAYGAVVTHTGSVDTPLGYGGEYTDVTTGLSYLRARYYDPATAQFLTVDPLVNVTHQAYAYVDDNPTNELDRTGQAGNAEELADAPGSLGDDLFALGMMREEEASIAEPIGTATTDAPENGSTDCPHQAAPETAATGGRSVREVLNNLPKGKQRSVRTVPDEETLQSMFGELTQGGTPTTWQRYDGNVFELPDGTQIGMRDTSGSGGSAIDIRVPGQDLLKIHIG